MGNMIYNGVELPDIDSVWTDKGTYPYVFMFKYDNGYYYFYYLLMTSAELVVDAETNNICFTDYGKSVRGIFKVSHTEGIQSDTVWSKDKSISTNPTLVLQSIDVYVPFWGMYDLMDKTGNIVLSASDPVDPNASVGIGLAKYYLLGQAVRRSLMGLGELTCVGYLYNGYPLPDINTVWTDKETYPEAAIVYTESDRLWWLLMFKKRLDRNNPVRGDETSYSISFDGKKQYQLYESTRWSYYGTSVNVGTISGNGRIIWSSTDVYIDRTSTDVFLHASAPTPVYISNQQGTALHSYNGIILQTVPDLDESEYPCQMICACSEGRRRFDYICFTPSDSHVPSANASDGGSTRTYVYWTGKFRRYILYETEWVLYQDKDNSGNTSYSYGETKPLWANVNVYDYVTGDPYNTDSVYLAASAPIPVYERSVT